MAGVSVLVTFVESVVDEAVVAVELEDVLVFEDSLLLKGFVITSADVKPIR